MKSRAAPVELVTNLTPEDAEGCGCSHLVVLAPRRSRLSAELGDERGDLGHVDTHCFGRQHRRVGLARVPPDLHAELGRSFGQGLAVQHAVGGKVKGRELRTSSSESGRLSYGLAGRISTWAR